MPTGKRRKSISKADKAKLRDKENDNGSRESNKRGDSEGELEETGAIDPAL